MTANLNFLLLTCYTSLSWIPEISWCAGTSWICNDVCRQCFAMSDNLTSNDLATCLSCKFLSEFVAVNTKLRPTTTLYKNAPTLSCENIKEGESLLWRRKERELKERSKRKRDSLCQGKGRKLWCTPCAPACRTIILVKWQYLVTDICCWRLYRKYASKKGKIRVDLTKFRAKQIFAHKKST